SYNRTESTGGGIYREGRDQMIRVRRPCQGDVQELTAGVHGKTCRPSERLRRKWRARDRRERTTGRVDGICRDSPSRVVIVTHVQKLASGIDSRLGRKGARRERRPLNRSKRAGGAVDGERRNCACAYLCGKEEFACGIDRQATGALRASHRKG